LESRGKHGVKRYGKNENIYVLQQLADRLGGPGEGAAALR
jgi:hypothetical protein